MRAAASAVEDEIAGALDGVFTVIPPYPNCVAETVSRLIFEVPGAADTGGAVVVGNVADVPRVGAGEADGALQVDTGTWPVSGMNPIDSVGLIASN